MANPWKTMTAADGQAMDERKERGPARFQVALKRELIWRLIEPRLPADRSRPVLDLGGGTGVWAMRLATAGHRVLLTDISPGLLERARQRIEAAGLRRLIEIREADMCELSWLPAESFALVLALGDPLSYCADAAAALAQIHRVTAASGVLIGDVENRYRAASSKRRAGSWEDARRILVEGIAHWPEADNPAPIREFAPQELRQVLGETGWYVERLYPSDLLAAMVGEERLRQGLESPEGMSQAIEMEERFREEPSLVGSGMELLSVATKRPMGQR